MRVVAAQEKAKPLNKSLPQRDEWPDLLNLPLMLGVIFVHTFDPVNAFGNGFVALQGRSDFADAVIYYFSQILCRLSVPIFFYFSGFFFFRQLGTAGLERWFVLIRKRALTLLVPFLLWNLLILLLFFFAQKLGVASGLASRIGNIGEMSFVNIVNVTFGLNGTPIAYQFWFVRDLIVCLILSALTLSFGFGTYLILVLCVFICWFFGYWPLAVPTSPAVFFFMAGGLAYKWSGKLVIDESPRWILLLYLSFSVFELYFINQEFSILLHRLNLVLGLCAASTFAFYLEKICWLKRFFIKYSPAAFFVFAFHEPLLTIIKKLLFVAIVNSSNGVFVLTIYFMSGLVVFVLSLLTWVTLRISAPRFLGVFTGGR